MPTPKSQGQTEWIRRHKKVLGGFGSGAGIVGLLAFAVPDYVKLRDCQAGQTAKLVEVEKRSQENQETIRRQWEQIGQLKLDVATLKARHP